MLKSIKYLMNWDLIAIANKLGFDYDKHFKVAFGDRNGYKIALVCSKDQVLDVAVSVSRAGEVPDRETIRLFVQRQRFESYSINNHRIMFSVRLSTNKDQRMAEVFETITTITDFLKSKGYENCCDECGRLDATDSCIISNKVRLCCSSCFEKAYEENGGVKVKREKKEKVIAGIFGALIGSLIGAFTIILIGLVGHTTWITGVILGACTVKGYEILGKKLTKKGVVISLALIVIMIFLAFQIFQIMELVKYLDINIYEDIYFFDLLKNYTSFIKKMDKFYPNNGLLSAYYQDLRNTYIYNLAGAVPTALAIINSIKVSKNAVNRTYKMGKNEIEY